jgi:7-carboxy-7-deazaguanine synthase
VSEIFGPTVQGEGALAGHPTVFIRLGGCDYRCSWCDSLFAVLPAHRHEWVKETPGDILARVEHLFPDPILLTISGGNPALHDLTELIAQARERGHTTALETQGSVARPWFCALDHLTLSPKPPSAGQPTPFGPVQECIRAAYSAPGPALARIKSFPATSICLKVVVFDETDYRYAKLVGEWFTDLPLYLSVGNPDVATRDLQGLRDTLLTRYEWLIERCLRDRWTRPVILPQIHALVWGNRRAV